MSKAKGNHMAAKTQPIIQHRKPRVLMIYTEWAANEYRKKNDLYGGVGYYRIAKPGQYLRQFYDVDVMGKKLLDYGEKAIDMWLKIYHNYDIVISKHIDDATTASTMIGMSRHVGVPVILDLDDNFLSIREDNPATAEYDVGKGRRYTVLALLGLADGLFVSTEPLKEAYAHINPRIDVLPNCNDVDDWKFMRAERDPKKVVIGYAGSITHDMDLALVIPALNEILKEYPDVEFQMLGAMHEETFRMFCEKLPDAREGQVKMRLGTPAWDGYPRLLSDMAWDIGIAPLLADDFTKCKSHIKWMEYAMYKIPTVVSGGFPYSEPIQGTQTVVDGKTGIVVNSNADWYNRLEELILDKGKREQIGQQAYDAVKNDWQWVSHAHKWKEAIDFYLSPAFKKPTLNEVQ